MEDRTRKRIGAGILSVVGGALASEWIVRGADAMMSLFYADGVLHWEALRNVVGLVALAVGLFFLFRPGGQSAEEKIVAKAVELGQSVAFQIGAFSGTARRPIIGELVSLYMTLARLGIATPDTTAGDLETVLGQANPYIASIMPLVRDGHLKIARREAPLVIAGIGAKTATPPKRKLWGLLPAR